MAVTRWDPFGELSSLRKEMDRVFSRIGFGEKEAGAWAPQIDVKTTGEDMVVYAEVPGMNRDDITVEVQAGTLTIRGERKAESEKTEEGWTIRERSYGSFERTLPLPDNVDADAITADYKDGVLEVHVPKGALPPPTHRVEVGKGETSAAPAVEAPAAPTTSGETPAA